MKSFLYRQSSLLLVCLAGVLLIIAWPPMPTFVFSFVAFALFLIAEDKLPRQKKHFFWHIFLGLLIWNIGTSYWIFHATPLGVFAWIINALLMTLPWLLYRWVKTKYNLRIGLFALIAAWLAFEWLHFNWELAWPWLALGNVFAATPNFVQWYEFTGTGGGTLWVLISNCLVFLWLKSDTNKPKFAYALLSIVLLPILASFIILNTVNVKSEKSAEFLVIQPNVNPYTKDYSFAEQQRNLVNLFNLADSSVTDDTDFIVFPETSLPGNPWRSQINSHPDLQKLRDILPKTEHGSIIVGADALKAFRNNEEKTATARYSENGEFYYDVYNASIFIRKDGENEFYAKSKLVPGVERMPYPKYLQPLQKLAIDLGGVGGSRATQKKRTVFTNKNVSVGTGICYESVFGDYMNDFVKNGAEILVIITNDGWWKNTSGYKQHLHYARLRAIETRKTIARSANTGISGFIDEKGKLLQQTNWWEKDTISATLPANNKITFYTRFGDYIYRTGLLFTFIVGLITFVKSKTKGFQYR